MKHGNDMDHSVPAQRTRHHGWRRLGIALLVFVLLAGAGRACLPQFARNYVNRTLDRNPLYAGEIGEVGIHLWRGAYSIENVRISKTTGAVPVPLFAARRVDFAMEWRALLHRRLVGRVLMEDPELNFVDAGNEAETQTGIGAPWMAMIQELFPFKINSATIRNGTVHFRSYLTAKPVDVYVSQLEATIDNLGNIRDESKPLVSTVQATGMVMDQAKLEYKMTLDPFSYRPTFHMGVRLLGLDVTKINDLALAYGKFDFKGGWFDFVMETDAKEGQLTGYAKPLFRDLKVFDPVEDIKEANVLKFFWQALVGGTTTVLKNQSRDQFGTLIPFSGEISGTAATDVLAAIGNVLRNAFIRAYLPRLEGPQQFEGLEFQAPEFSELISVDGV
jgi:hypothetical protein